MLSSYTNLAALGPGDQLDLVLTGILSLVGIGVLLSIVMAIYRYFFVDDGEDVGRAMPIRDIARPIGVMLVIAALTGASRQVLRELRPNLVTAQNSPPGNKWVPDGYMSNNGLTLGQMIEQASSQIGNKKHQKLTEIANRLVAIEAERDLLKQNFNQTSSHTQAQIDAFNQRMTELAWEEDTLNRDFYAEEAKASAGFLGELPFAPQIASWADFLGEHEYDTYIENAKLAQEAQGKATAQSNQAVTNAAISYSDKADRAYTMRKERGMLNEYATNDK